MREARKPPRIGGTQSPFLEEGKTVMGGGCGWKGTGNQARLLSQPPTPNSAGRVDLMDVVASWPQNIGMAPLGLWCLRLGHELARPLDHSITLSIPWTMRRTERWERDTAWR